MKVKETFAIPPFSGQNVRWAWGVRFLQPLTERAIDITAIAMLKRSGRKAGPGLSMVPRGYFLDSKRTKRAKRTNTRLVTFSVRVNAVPRSTTPGVHRNLIRHG
jgi:hypothetical protein